MTSRVFFNFGSGVAAWHTITLYFNFIAPTAIVIRQGAYWIPNGIFLNVSPAILRTGFCVLVIDNAMSLLSIGGPQGDIGAIGVLKVTLPF